ncbi:MAG: YggS family pyridoxal phosphate-dependent enzyme [Tannerellaceae bacterium]
MSITGRITQLRASLPEGVTLLAVSKFHPAEAVLEAYQAGQRVFGESRAQEVAAKQQALPSDIEWHFIGPLQSNKVKEIAPFIHTIQSIDSLKLLLEADKQAKKNNRVIQLLLEIHIAEEETKHGLTAEECKTLLKDDAFATCRNIYIGGLMGMATNTDDTKQIRKEFRALHTLFTELKNDYFTKDERFSILSLGMSHDYRIAIEEGSTLVRIGTDIFGEREY